MERDYCSVQELYNFLYWDYLIIDTRNTLEYEEWHLHVAVNFPASSSVNELLNRLSDCYPEQKERIVLYHHSPNAPDLLQQAVFIETLLSDQNSSLARNYSRHSPKVTILNGDIQQFYNEFPFYFSDHPEGSGEVYPSLITKKLYLSSSLCAESQRVLQNLGIKTVINCSTSIPNFFENKLPIEYIRVSIEDDQNENLLGHLDKINQQIQDREHQPILVHCARGQSRSASVLIGYLIYSTKCSYLEALFAVQKARSVIKPNPGFVTQLELYASRHIQQKPN